MSRCANIGHAKKTLDACFFLRELICHEWVTCHVNKSWQMWYVWVMAHCKWGMSRRAPTECRLNGTWQNEFFLNSIGVSHDSYDVWVMAHSKWVMSRHATRGHTSSHDSCDMCGSRLMWIRHISVGRDRMSSSSTWLEWVMTHVICVSHDSCDLKFHHC